MQKGKNPLNYCERAFFTIKDCDIDPIIFLRLAKPLGDPSIELPYLNPEDYYPKTEAASFVDIEVKPDFKSIISKELIDFGGSSQYH